MFPLGFAPFVLALAAAFQIPNRDYDARQYFIVELDGQKAPSGDSLGLFIDQFNETFTYEHPVRGLDDHYVFSVPKEHAYMDFMGNYKSNDYNLLKRSVGFELHHDALVAFPSMRLIHMLEPKILEKRLPVTIERDDAQCKRKRLEAVDSSQLPAKEVSDKLDIQDPIFFEQWHLVNTLSPGNDVNVKNVWYDGVRGKGVTVAIVDDGLDYETKDLADNFSKDGLWDFNDNNPLPKPRLFDDYHGTRCAGEVAGVKNDVCGVGVAYESKVAGIRILSGKITSEEEAAAMIYGLDHNDIYSCSWGPTDNGRTVAAPEAIVQKAIIKGVQDGRNGKGALYVFASGNGGRVGDQCNFDGYTNSIYSITIGAIDYHGSHPSYAETCSAVMVVTYSSGSGEHIHTTDIHKKCTTIHGGTSAAAPLAAGLFALALQVNPELTWRDMQYVTAISAVPVNEDDGEYQDIALGHKYSHKYGFGKIDAEKLVEQAKNWTNKKPQAWYYGDVVSVDKRAQGAADANSETITSTWNVTEEDLELMNLETLEHVTVKVNIGSNFRGKIDVKLISPTGIVSKLAWFRDMDSAESGLIDWTFMSVAHFGEKGVGEWKIEVFGGTNNEIHFKNWQLKFYGESIDADKVEVYDLDKDYALVKKERLENKHLKPEEPQEPSLSTVEESTTSSPVDSTTSQEPTTTATSSEAVTSTSESATVPSSATSATASATATNPSGEQHSGESKSSFLTLGQSVLGFAVIVFVCVICYIKWPRNQSSSRRRRGDYEFDVIPGEDYTDSEDDNETFELTPSQEDLEQERLFTEADITGAGDYDDDMFQVGDEDFDKEHGEGTTTAATDNDAGLVDKKGDANIDASTDGKQGNAK